MSPTFLIHVLSTVTPLLPQRVCFVLTAPSSEHGTWHFVILLSFLRFSQSLWIGVEAWTDTARLWVLQTPCMQDQAFPHPIMVESWTILNWIPQGPQGSWSPSPGFKQDQPIFQPFENVAQTILDRVRSRGLSSSDCVPCPTYSCKSHSHCCKSHSTRFRKGSAVPSSRHAVSPAVCHTSYNQLTSLVLHTSLCLSYLSSPVSHFSCSLSGAGTAMSSAAQLSNEHNPSFLDVSECY